MNIAVWFGGGPSSGNGAGGISRSARTLRLVREAATGAEPALPRPDAVAIANIRSGNIAAFESMFRASYAGLVRFATRYTRSADAAEDVVADVFTAVWHQRATWSPERGIRAYLYGAVRNRAMNAVRDARRRTELEDDLARANDALDQGAAQETADVAWERQEPLRMLDQMVRGLSERARLVIELRWQHQLDFHEIAAVLGTTRATAFNLHARAMRTLRRIFPDSFREYLD